MIGRIPVTITRVILSCLSAEGLYVIVLAVEVSEPVARRSRARQMWESLFGPLPGRSTPSSHNDIMDGRGATPYSSFQSAPPLGNTSADVNISREGFSLTIQLFASQSHQPHLHFRTFRTAIMSAPHSQKKDAFGTDSPPLEATQAGGEEPMGVSSISGEKPKGVPDQQQRGGARARPYTYRRFRCSLNLRLVQSISRTTGRSLTLQVGRLQRA